MTRARLASSLLVVIVLALPALAADPLMTATGTIDKVEKDSLTIRPRGPDGKFEKAVTLKLTGTSKISTLAPQTRGGKTVLTQKDTDAKDLKAKQTIAVIYTSGSAGTVLLAAVVQPAS